MPVLVLRSATLDDAADLLQWRNDIATRENSLSTEPVSPDTHAAWLTASLANPDRILLIGMEGAAKIGSVRFDRIGGERARCTVSIMIAPAARGRRMGRELLMAACRSVAPRTLEATIKDTNGASLRIFAACGFTYVGPVARTGFGLYRAELQV